MATILDRVDSSQRLVPTFKELAGALRRASDVGRIRQVGPGQYVDASRSGFGDAVVDLSVEEYQAAVREYHEGFARDVLAVSPWLKATSSMFEATHRLTGGRSGLPPAMVDADGVALTFVFDVALEQVGWTCEAAYRVDGVRVVQVAPMERTEPDVVAPADRATVTSIVAATLQQHPKFKGAHRILFPDGEGVDMAAT